jgi:hypothetical protein
MSTVFAGARRDIRTVTLTAHVTSRPFAEGLSGQPKSLKILLTRLGFCPGYRPMGHWCRRS